MSPLSRNAVALICASSLAWLYLYLYPLWHGCSFPQIRPHNAVHKPSSALPFLTDSTHSTPPFRLLVLADPQLEGDSSLHAPSTPNFSPASLLTGEYIVTAVKYWRKRLDLLGNDYYLAHIYRTLRLFTSPTHVTVLGDLLGSQWVSDDEFWRRAGRFWGRTFRGGRRVEDAITSGISIQAGGEEEGAATAGGRGRAEILGADRAWPDRVICIAGNHDVGYAGDMTPERTERFERAFGRANWEISFALPTPTKANATDSVTDADAGKGAEKPARASGPPMIRLLVLNSMNLDTPALRQDLQAQTYAQLNSFITNSRTVEDSTNVLTILLTHVPLHKREGVCVDSPHFDFYPQDDGGGVREQNHISRDISRALLEGIWGMNGEGGMGRKGLILTGHDHEGCDVWHHLPEAGADRNSWEEADEEGAEDPARRRRRWAAVRYSRLPNPDNPGTSPTLSTASSSLPGIREVTLRSMMGEFGGNAGLLSAWFDEGSGEWDFDIVICALGAQHGWWAVHVLFLVTAVVIGVAVLQWQVDSVRRRSREVVVERKGGRGERDEVKNSRMGVGNEDRMRRGDGGSGTVKRRR